MATPGSTRGGRRGRGRGAPTRQSKRLQGLPPEEQPDLDAIQKAAREKRKAAREKTAAESVNVPEPTVEDQPAEEPESQETPAVSGEQGSEDGPSEVGIAGDEVTTAREGGDEASEGGVDMVESPEVVDLCSESTTSGQSVDEVKSESGYSENHDPQSSRSEEAPMSDSTPIKSEDSLKTPSDESGRADSLDGERALKYVRREFRRWRDMDAGRVVPPNVEYVWPTTKPSADVFQKAAAATGDYIKWRCSSVFPEDTWISEFHVRRHGFGRIQDLSYVEIPMSTLTAPECVAILQTMLYEAGFEFQNLLPRWSQTQASAVFESQVRSVATELQSRLAMELVEWATVTARLQVNRLPEIIKQEDITSRGEADSVLPDKDADLQGRQLIMRLRVTGLRVTHSSDGSSSDEPPQSKRLQQRPPRTQIPSTPSALSTPSLSSLPQYESRSGNTRSESENPMSEDQNSSQARMTDAPVPSVIGTSDDQSTGFQTSRGSSTDSSLMSVSRGAASHMPLSAGGLALIAQGTDVGGLVSGDGMGIQVTRTLLPVKPESEDVDMSEEKPEVPDVKSENQAPVEGPSSDFSRPTPEVPPSSVSSRSASHRSHRQSVKSEDLLKTPSRRLSSIASSRTKSEARSSQRSGPAQIELNVMRQQQEWQSRMEQAQMEFLARERLESMERDRRREQRDLEARREIQTLTDRLLKSENARLEAERRADDAEERRSLVSERKLRNRDAISELETLKSRQNSEIQRLESEFADRWRQREAEAEAERARVTDEMKRDWISQMEALQQRMKDMEAERDREKESSQNMQRFQAGQLKNLRATLSQVQEARRVGHPDSATATPMFNTGNPEVATMYPVSESEIRSDASGVRVEPMSHSPALTTGPREVAAFQEAAPARSEATKRVKAERNGAAATTATATQVTQAAPVTEAKGDTRRASTSRRDPPRKTDARRPDGGREAPRREKRRGGAPDPGGDSEDSSSDSESSSSDDSELGEVVNLTAATQAQAGTTLLTLRPFMNSNNLGEFDPRATLRERVHWWERFTNMASQGGWSTKTRIQELKLKLPVSARDWFNQLPKSVSRDWKELSSEFKKRYCKARSSYSERYFTMAMKDSETPLEFFYRLNSAAGKADIDFRKSSKRLEKHVLRFITKLKDARLKTSLQGQRFRRISDLEYALQQDEDVWRTGDQETTAAKPRDFRADNIPRGQFKPKRMNRTYVARDLDSEDSDDDDSENYKGSLKSNQDNRDQTGDSRLPSATSESTCDGNTAQTSSSASTAPPSADWTQTLTNEVYRVMDNMGWRPPPQSPSGSSGQGFHQKRHENGGYWNKFCEKCQRSGHSEEDCWRDITCDRCQEKGHPSRMCRVPPCEVCGRVHLGKPCEDLKTLEALKQLARQGALKDMPNHLREKLLGDEADSGKPLN
ncbi:hypothetical protein P3T76_012275 [Phytophthora citrophthora]|uniref:Retrotransposon gag domain-containing protein n=1 Tax=Phytophthora citrophthora TaxID=4793 RepID=A0AAD9G5L2_9STRA|nr:hypothetical protein P3T76_012275 [Phytophthora citrophthora]